MVVAAEHACSIWMDAKGDTRSTYSMLDMKVTGLMHRGVSMMYLALQEGEGENRRANACAPKTARSGVSILVVRPWLTHPAWPHHHQLLRTLYQTGRQRLPAACGRYDDMCTWMAASYQAVGSAWQPGMG